MGAEPAENSGLMGGTMLKILQTGSGGVHATGAAAPHGWGRQGAAHAGWAEAQQASSVCPVPRDGVEAATHAGPRTAQAGLSAPVPALVRIVEAALWRAQPQRRLPALKSKPRAAPCARLLALVSAA